jgi:hypothetical protein
MTTRRKLETNPLRYTDLERSILIDLRVRSRSNLPIPRGYIVHHNGTLSPVHHEKATRDGRLA